MHRTGSWHGKCLLQSWFSSLHDAVCCRELWLCLTRCTALVSFRRNLSLVKELGDRAAQGRAYGNLGNTQYLLGNFSEAIAFHKEVGNLCTLLLGSGAEPGCWEAAFHQSTLRCFPPAAFLPPVYASGSGPVVPAHASVPTST